MDKSCLSDPERMVIEYISELFIFNQGVQSKTINRAYEYLESKTVKAIEENNFTKIIKFIIDSYGQNEDIKYPQVWVQSVFARVIGTRQWDITPGILEKNKKPPNAFHNFDQRQTNYDDLVLESVKNMLKEYENEEI